MRSVRGTLALASIIAVVVSGCKHLTPPIEQPVIEDHSGALGTFATVAERRMVITKRDFGGNGPEGFESKFCAEPPPDATQSIASSLSAALRADAAQDKSKRSVSAEMARELATTTKSLFERSQGVQIFRDGVYTLCQAHLNHAMDEYDYNWHFSELLAASVALIKLELIMPDNTDVAKARSAADLAEDAAGRVEEAAGRAVTRLATQKAEVDSLRKSAETASKDAEAARKAADIAQEKAEEAATRAETAAQEAGETAKE